MLQLINYDLQEPVKNYPTLQKGVERIGGGIHILNGPWIYGADRSPQDVLASITNAMLAAYPEDTNDKLLVFPVNMGELGIGRNLKQEEIKYPEGKKVFAVTCTSRNPLGSVHIEDAEYQKHRTAIVDLLNKDVGTTCHPLEGLWFVKTDESAHSAHDVHLRLEKAVPLNPKDELMVVEVDLQASMAGKPVKGAEKGLDVEDRKWLVEAGVL